MIVKRPDNFFPDLSSYTDQVGDAVDSLRAKLSEVFQRSARAPENLLNEGGGDNSLDIVELPPTIAQPEEVEELFTEEETIPQRTLLDAVSNGNLEEIQELLEREDTDIDASDYGRNAMDKALRRAAQEDFSEGSLQILKLLCNKTELSPLFPVYVVYNSNYRLDLEKLEKLLDCGLDPNFVVDLSPDSECGGSGPIIERAIMEEDVETVKLLLSSGADPNHSSSILHTAIIAKEYFGGTQTTYRKETSYPNPEILKILLEAKGNPNTQNNQGETLLHTARSLLYHSSNLFSSLRQMGFKVIEQLNPAIDLLLLQGADPSIRDYQGRSPSDRTNFWYGSSSKLLKKRFEQMDSLRPCNDLFQRLRLFCEKADKK